MQCDLPPQERKLSRDAGAKYAQEQGLLFEETSAKSGDNVDKIFLSLGAFVRSRSRTHTHTHTCLTETEWR